MITYHMIMRGSASESETQLQAYVEQARRAGRVLDGLRAAELRQLDDAQARRELLDVLELAEQLPFAPRTASGLVELHARLRRIFAR